MPNSFPLCVFDCFVRSCSQDHTASDIQTLSVFHCLAVRFCKKKTRVTWTGKDKKLVVKICQIQAVKQSLKCHCWLVCELRSSDGDFCALRVASVFLPRICISIPTLNFSGQGFAPDKIKASAPKSFTFVWLSSEQCFRKDSGRNLKQAFSNRAAFFLM